MNLIFVFSLWCIDCVGSLYANRIFMYFCIQSSIGLASCKSAVTQTPLPVPVPTATPTTTTVVYSTGRSKAVVPVLVLLFVALWFILWGDLFCLALCYFALVFISPFSIAITKRLILVLFVRLFERKKEVHYFNMGKIITVLKTQWSHHPN